MGYYTRYRLDWSPKQGDSVANALQIENLAEELEDACKWYEHEEQMKAFSTRFPDVVFTLNGAGEEPGDVWVKYFKNGKMQTSRLEIQLAPFDESKLT